VGLPAGRQARPNLESAARMLINPAHSRWLRLDFFPAPHLLSLASSSSAGRAATTSMPRQVHRSMLSTCAVALSATKRRPIFPCESIATTIIAHRGRLRKAEQFSPEQNWQKT
jgi:hypothetical protein